MRPSLAAWLLLIAESAAQEAPAALVWTRDFAAAQAAQAADGKPVLAYFTFET